MTHVNETLVGGELYLSGINMCLNLTRKLNRKKLHNYSHDKKICKEESYGAYSLESTYNNTQNTIIGS